MSDHYESTIRTWSKLAEVYHEKFKDVRLYDRSYEAFATHIRSERPSILEIGCGPGTVTRWLKDRLPNSQILATDVAPEMIHEAKKHLDGVKFSILDARNIDSLSQKFDAILVGFCIPYLMKTDLEKFVKNASSLLEAHGVLYLSFIEGNYENSQLQTGSTGDSMKVHYYQESDLLQQFHENGLTPIETINISYPLSNESIQTHIALISQKQA